MANTGIGRIFLRKSVDQIQAEHRQGELKRSLGALNLMLLGVGCVIGAGIFVLTGRAAAQFAGPAIMVSFVIPGSCVPLSLFAMQSWPQPFPFLVLRIRTLTHPWEKDLLGSWVCFSCWSTASPPQLSL